jgi:hypothetical protein
LVGFEAILRRLTEHGVEFFVIGGIAASLHGSPVQTFDVDVCIPFRRPNVDRLLEALDGINPKLRMRPDKLRLAVGADYLAGCKNLYLLTDLGVLDLLGEVPGVGSYDELVDKTVVMNFQTFSCRILDLDTLIVAKRFAGRPKDLISVEELEKVRRRRRDEPGLF